MIFVLFIMAPAVFLVLSLVLATTLLLEKPKSAVLRDPRFLAWLSVWFVAASLAFYDLAYFIHSGSYDPDYECFLKTGYEGYSVTMSDFPLSLVCTIDAERHRAEVVPAWIMPAFFIILILGLLPILQLWRVCSAAKRT